MARKVAEKARKAAEDLRERLDIYAIAHRDDDAYCTRTYCTRIDGDASMVGRWLACSYSESNNDLNFFYLSTGEAAELIRTFDEMQMAKKHPWRKRDEEGE